MICSKSPSMVLNSYYYFYRNKDRIYYCILKKNTMHPDLFLNDTKLTDVNNHTHLRLIISNNMSWSSHIKEILAKAEKILSIMQRSKYFLPRKCLDKLYKNMILPLLDYSDVIYDYCTMKVNNLINYIRKPTHDVLVHSGSPVMKNYKKS